jgi:hypothetical protein
MLLVGTTVQAQQIYLARTNQPVPFHTYRSNANNMSNKRMQLDTSKSGPTDARRYVTKRELWKQ